MRCNEDAEGSEKMSKCRHLSNRASRRSTIHLRGFLLPLCNFLSLKHLTAAQDKRQLWHLKCQY